MTEPGPVVGCIGLGNMGSALAANLVAAGHVVVAHDAAGESILVDGATWARDVAEVARVADVVVLSLPDGAVSELVARQLVAAEGRHLVAVVDTSTIGPAAAAAVDAVLAEAGVAYVDAPVSGGVAGARARTLAVMFSGTDAAVELASPVLQGLSDRLRRVGDRPGLAQAVKLANNFLSATALAATSEAVAFGVSVGVDMALMLEVLSASSGANTATTDKFPNHVVTGTYASGFSNSLMAKDVALYLEAAQGEGTPSSFGSLTADTWRAFAAAQPHVDFTRIHRFVNQLD